MAQSNVMFRGKRFSVTREAQRLPDGTTHERDIVRHPGAVAILPVLDDGRIVLIRNYRVAAGRVLLEVPAGTREPGEAPETTALRELTEETGYRCGKLEPLTGFFTSPGVLDEWMVAYLATGLVPGEQALDAGEQIELAPLSLDDALAQARDGRLEDGKTLAVLLYYAMFRKEG